ncbi:endonuclease/exonuclease/phosphatase family protein [uncultured Nocardioides sp.]|uniref:endonuclease/exonuclease/phosphatase family protein n=1 Tax=uncultured Nocardioides sp. TaxID=198441 RepID=UPI002627388B|nr:endonuclease/exonuclease/phosphatase family protein [uncultured Nocardioides sp.]
MLSSRSLGALLAAGVVVVSAGIAAPGAHASVVAPAPRADAGEAVVVMSWNIAGGKQHGGGVEPIVPTIATAIRERGVTAAVLNEVCASQATALRKRMPRYTVHYFLAESDRCRGGIGNAVVAPKGSTRLKRFSRGLPSGDSYVRNVGCVRLPGGGKVAVCGTHHSFEVRLADVRQRQARITTDLVERMVDRGYAVVAGGDLNATPRSPQLDEFYSRLYAGGRGVLRESNGCCGRRGPGTTRNGGKKIDYFFFSRRLDRTGSRVVPTRFSDHRQVVLRTRLR